jgi:formate dehydrogenase subunit gamma
MTVQHIETPVIVARDRDNVVVGEEIVRHRLATRLIHWSVAITFFIALISGMPIWTPLFGWMAVFVGGLEVARLIHPYAGVAFFIASIFQFVHWLPDMHLHEDQKGWLSGKAFRYMRWERVEESGKYNGGQILYFWAVCLGALGFLLSGIPMWFPLAFPKWVLEICILIHDLTFILFVVGLAGHIYLGTAAEPGTFRAMTRGTVTRRWARFHHPGWYKEVTGEDTRK